MPNLNCYIRSSLEIALERCRQQTGASTTQIVQTALTQYFGTPFAVQPDPSAAVGDRGANPVRRRRSSQRLRRPGRLELHTLFHVTTTGSLVAGLYDGAVSVADMERHGNFGLGMFSGLDDEMVVLDGSAYHVKGDGTVKAAGVGAAATFAVVTFFQGASMVETGSIASFEALKAYCDGIRPSDNLFYAFRVEGRFRHIRLRAVCTPQPGGRLRKASDTVDYSHLHGTLVGMWFPESAATFTVAGYHFFFLSRDRSKGGAVLHCDGVDVKIRGESLSDFHLALPESALFLQADLSSG